jgi:hypothetical protein
MNQLKHSFLLAGFLAILPVAAWAGELSQGELISVVNEVTLGDAGAAKPNDKLNENTPVTTGSSSFAEIQFKDSSVLRLAPETKMAFVSKDRALRLHQGSLLANVPAGMGGIRIEADGISGEVTGTSLMASRDRDGNFGFILLETSGTAKVTSNTGQTASLAPGQIALVRKTDGSIRVFEINLDAVVQFSPLFTSFERAMPGLDQVMAVADGQAGEVKNEIKSLLSYSEVGLKEGDPDKNPLAILFGLSTDEMVASKNPFLGELSTAAGTEEGKDGSASGVVLGGDSGQGGAVSDARQPEGEEIASNSNPPSGDAAAGLGDTDTAAGAEDLAATDTAAGGGGGADTQAPTAPAPVSGGVTANQPQATPTGGTG